MKSFNKVAGGILGASLLLGATACSDDHYDIREAQASAANTIWQNIEGNQQLDSLAMILKRTNVYRKETDKSAGQTYAELLNQPQTFTFWAPVNGSYNAKSILDQLDEADALIAEGKIAEGHKMNYVVGQQFVQNHMARFNFESNHANQEVRLLNSKLTYYNAAAATFNSVPLYTAYANVPSSNGNLHVLNGRSPFAYNIFDYMKSYSDYSKIYAALSDSLVDTDTFSPESSIQGAMNELGQMVYVDSVYINSNTILTASHASIKNEDSLYISVIPTDKAWDEGFEKVGKLYNYAKKYKTGYNKESADIFTQNYTLNADSLKQLNTNSSLISNMFFSPGYFTEEISRTDSAALLNYFLNADSVQSTTGIYLYNPNPGQPNSMFAGITPVKASNGYIFPLESYTIDPTYFQQQKLTYDLTYTSNVGYSSNIAESGGSQITLVENSNWDKTIVGGDALENQTYRFFQANGQMKVYIPLRNVLSGTYRVKMQIIPNRINYEYKLYDENGEELVDRENYNFRCSIHADEYNETLGKNTTININQDSVQTVTLFDEVTFTKCYASLPSDLESFPVLVIEFPRTLTNKYTYKDMVVGLSARKVILEPVHE